MDGPQSQCIYPTSYNPGPPPSDSSFVQVLLVIRFQPKPLPPPRCFLSRNLVCIPGLCLGGTRYIEHVLWTFAQSINQSINHPSPVSVVRKTSLSSSTVHNFYFWIPRTVSHRTTVLQDFLWGRVGGRCGAINLKNSVKVSTIK